MSRIKTPEPNELLEFERTQRYWARKYVADQLGVPDERTVAKWERKGIKPSATYLPGLCKLYGKSARELGFVRKGVVPYWRVSYHRNPFFVGREEELALLHEILTKEHAATLSQAGSIKGLGGVGKTQLAIEYAYRYGEEYRAVFWVRAESRDLLVTEVMAIAQQLRVPNFDLQDQQQALASVRYWMESISRWLFIFDNVQDVHVMQDFLPQKGRGHILITTRLQFPHIIPQSIDLDVLGVEEGTLFLLRRAGLIDEAQHKSVPENVLEQAKELVDQLGRLPLALEQAAAYISETGCTVEDYLELYQQRGVTMLADEKAFFFEHPHSVVSTFALSFKKVREMSPLAAQLLCFLAFLHPDAIPEELVIGASVRSDSSLASIAGNKHRFNLLIRELRRYSLIKRSRSQKSLEDSRKDAPSISSTACREPARSSAPRNG